jgi:hypothetical protein
MVHFEVTNVIRRVKYCNFSSCIMKLQYLKCILTIIFFSKIKVEKTQFSYEIYQSGSQWKGVDLVRMVLFRFSGFIARKITGRHKNEPSRRWFAAHSGRIFFKNQKVVRGRFHFYGMKVAWLVSSFCRSSTRTISCLRFVLNT